MDPDSWLVFRQLMGEKVRRYGNESGNFLGLFYTSEEIKTSSLSHSRPFLCMLVKISAEVVKQTNKLSLK
jgi:hypothetical protein